jgi:transcriptional regulator with XRE-family HTH domain
MRLCCSLASQGFVYYQVVGSYQFVIYDVINDFIHRIWIIAMGSPKSKPSLERLGHDIRGARLRRGIAVADLAVRAGTSPSTVARLEKGDPGVGIGTLADVLVVLGLVDRLADLIDIRKDDLGLALAAERQPRRGRSFATALRRQKAKGKTAQEDTDVVDLDGASF